MKANARTYRILSYICAGLMLIFAVPPIAKVLGYPMSSLKSMPPLFNFIFLFPTLFFSKKAEALKKKEELEKK